MGPFLRGQSDISPQVPMPVENNESFSTSDVAAGTLTWLYSNSGVWASATGQAAATICMGVIGKRITNSGKTTIGSFNDTSFVPAASTRIDTKVSIPESDLSALQFMSVEDQVALVAKTLKTNGYYAIDHRRGVIWAKPKAIVANDTVVYTYLAGVSATVDTTGLATSTLQTSGAQKTQIVDAGGEVATITDGKLDVNATVSMGADATVDLNKVKGTTTDVGNGEAGAGTLRVTVANNSTGTTAVTQATATNLKTQAEVYQGGAAVAVGNPLEVKLPAATVTTLTPPAAITGFATSTKQLPDGHGVAIADGSLATLGAKADAKSAATDTTPVTAMQVLKEISHMEQNPASRAVTNGGTFAVQAAATKADGADVTLGAKADAKSAATDTTPVTAMQVLKEISYMEQNPATPLPNSADLATLATAHVKKYYTNAGAVTDGIIWSPAAGKRWFVTDIFIQVSAAATVTLEDDLAGGDSPIWKAELAANSGWSKGFVTPWFSGEDAADLIITTTAGNVYVTVVGYEI